jgi:hypothetical protein
LGRHNRAQAGIRRGWAGIKPPPPRLGQRINIPAGPIEFLPGWAGSLLCPVRPPGRAPLGPPGRCPGWAGWADVPPGHPAPLSSRLGRCARLGLFVRCVRLGLVASCPGWASLSSAPAGGLTSLRPGRAGSGGSGQARNPLQAVTLQPRMGRIKYPGWVTFYLLFWPG